MLHADNLPPHYADLAYHYEQAGVEQKAIDYHHKAGDYARENYAVGGHWALPACFVCFGNGRYPPLFPFVRAKNRFI
jgi:hypothetical protein